MSLPRLENIKPYLQEAPARSAAAPLGPGLALPAEPTPDQGSAGAILEGELDAPFDWRN